MFHRRPIDSYENSPARVEIDVFTRLCRFSIQVRLGEYAYLFIIW